MFVYQPTLNTLQIKYEKTTGNVISWKSKGVYTTHLKSLHGVFFASIKIWYKKKQPKFSLVVEEKNYSTEIIKVYIVYYLNDCPKVLLRNFTLKN